MFPITCVWRPSYICVSSQNGRYALLLRWFPINIIPNLLKTLCPKLELADFPSKPFRVITLKLWARVQMFNVKLLLLRFEHCYWQYNCLQGIKD